MSQNVFSKNAVGQKRKKTMIAEKMGDNFDKEKQNSGETQYESRIET